MTGRTRIFPDTMSECSVPTQANITLSKTQIHVPLIQLQKSSQIHRPSKGARHSQIPGLNNDLI
jgi:hypothetical protein